MNKIFSTDWYNRDNSTYTANKSTIDWTLYKDGLCKFLYSPTEIYDFINDTRVLAREMRSIIDVLNIKNVGVYIDTENGDSMTDGHNITVSSKFTPEIINQYEKLDLELGLLFHEASHCLFTNFNYMVKQSYKISKMVHWIQNVIEDEIIEEKLGRKNPGYDKFISKVKYHYFDTCVKDQISKPRENELDEWCRLFLYVIRYPKYVSELPAEVLDKYADMFEKIANIMSNFECGNYNFTRETIMDEKAWMQRDNTRDSINAAIEIEKLLKEYFPDYEKQSIEVTKKYGEGGKATVVNITKTMDGETSMSETMGKETTGYRIEITERIKEIKMKEANLEDNSVSCGSEGKTLLSTNFAKTSVIPSPAKYNAMYAEMKPFMNIAEKIIVNNSHKDIIEEIRFKRNGSLDSRRLADAMMNINTVYQQNVTKRIDIKGGKYAFVMIIDESGSMSGFPRNFAQKIAILFSEVLLKNNNIELYVYGHGDYITKYINKENRNKYNLGYVRLQGNQNDADSYTKIIDDVKSQTNLPIVCLNITDGYYLSDTTPMVEFFETYREKHVSFNLLNLGKAMSPRQAEINETVYGGDVVQLETNNADGIKDMISKLAKVIQKNYKKYSK